MVGLGIDRFKCRTRSEHGPEGGESPCLWGGTRRTRSRHFPKRRPISRFWCRRGGVWAASGRRLGGVWAGSGRHLGGVWEASGRRLGGVWAASGRRLGGGILCWSRNRPFGVQNALNAWSKRRGIASFGCRTRCKHGPETRSKSSSGCRTRSRDGPERGPIFEKT